MEEKKKKKQEEKTKTDIAQKKVKVQHTQSTSIGRLMKRTYDRNITQGLSLQKHPFKLLNK